MMSSPASPFYLLPVLLLPGLEDFVPGSVATGEPVHLTL